ncbi:MAG TPA: AAA family ATPase [Solirubrobacteraceae bacterium]|nr:AAA family ATPase [Solirubrobacteraceae bacterium]
MRRSSSTAVPALLERDREFDQLSAWVAAAVGGDGSIVAIEGEAGIGKSALVAHVTQQAAESGMRALSARCGELEQDFGYGVVRQLFDAPLAAMESDERSRVLGGAAGLATAALSVSDSSANPADPAAVLHGLYWLTANLAAEQPLLIVIDDAHWADSASIAFLSYLARRMDGLGLLVVYATRVGEGASDRLPATADPGLVRTVLRPGVLGERSTQQLIGQLLGSVSSPEFANACRVATAGNPFLLEELLRALQSEGIAPEKESSGRVAQIAPEAIRRSILARLRRLGPSTTQLAFAIAVLGKSAELRHAATLANVEIGAAGTAADALAGAAILRDGRPLEFIHPIVRATVYAEIPAAQRAASHRLAASLLERDAVAPAELAPHLMASEPAGDPEVVRLLQAAAAEVRDRGASETACAYLERALAEPPRSEHRAAVMQALGSAEVAAGRLGALGHLREALDGDLEPRAQMTAALDYGAALVMAGRTADVIELLDKSSARLADEGDLERAMQLEGVLVCTAQLDPTTAKPARARLASYEGRLRGESIGERLLLAVMAFDGAHRPLPAEHAAGLAELALTDWMWTPERIGSANFALAIWTLMVADRLERAEELCSGAVEDARARGSLFAFAIATGARCQIRIRLGRLAEAEAEARSCLDAVGDARVVGRPMLIACVLDAMVERCEIEECQAFLAEHQIQEEMGSVSLTSRLLYSRGHLRLVAGDPAGALRDFEQIRARDERSGLDPAGVPTRASAALAHAQLGEHEHAQRLARQQVDQARVWGTPFALSFALRTAGIIEGGNDGVELLREAAAVVEPSPARYERALSLTAYGAALRRAGHRRDARQPLREALELADRCGARRTAARAREELLATGARPRRAALSGADSLTPSEQRVARLATDGLTNREIAQALFVTIRTVEGHLRQAYMKLDITSREQLAAALQSPAGS